MDENPYQSPKDPIFIPIPPSGNPATWSGPIPIPPPDFAVAVYWGVRVLLPRGTDLRPLQLGEDERLQRASRFGLDAEWFWTYVEDSDNESFCLLVGRKLGNLGEYGDYERSIPADELLELLRTTTEKLREAGFNEPVSLHMICDPDM